MTLNPPADLKPPQARSIPTTRRVHDTVIEDPFAWLRADNWQEVLSDPTVLPANIRAVLDAENAYAEALLAAQDPLKRELLAEMRARIKEEDADPPCPDGPFDYYERTREGGQHELYCRRARGGGPETVLLDGDKLAKGHDYFSFGDAMHAPDHGLLAWSADTQGSELHTIRFLDMTKRRNKRDRITRTDGTVVWTTDGSAVYYVKIDKNHRPARIMRHRLGTPMATDELVFEEKNPALFAHLEMTRSRRFAVIRSHDHDSSESRLLDLDVPTARPRLIEPRQPGLRYEVEHHDDSLLIRCNADGAQDFKIMQAPLGQMDRSHWRDLIAYVPGRMCLSLAVFKDHLVWMEREAGLPRIMIRRWADGDTHAIAFDEKAYALGLDPGYEFDTPWLRFTYSSMATPHRTFDYHMANRARQMVKEQVIPSGHKPEDYITDRIFARSPDGLEVPVSLIYRKDTSLDGSAPLLLYGYGAYGHALSASFSTSRLSLVDRGFVYAIAHVRGGTEKGFGWYEQGKLAHKPNTFHDFLSAARHLIAGGYTSKGRIVAHGGSAGGMLMGAIANMAPELFAAILADVPFVDVLNTMLDASLPLTPPEWQEWGNPIESREAFASIAAYSPYDNIKPQNYPAIFAQGGLSDPRVTYWEPAKWVARLRQTMTGGGPILLKTNMEAGHGGASGRFDHLAEIATDYAFALTMAGQSKAGK